MLFFLLFHDLLDAVQYSDITWRCKWHLGLQLWQVSAHSFAVWGSQTLCPWRQTLHAAPSGQRQSSWVSLKQHISKRLSLQTLLWLRLVFIVKRAKFQLVCLWLEVRCELRGNLDSVIAPLRIAVFHVYVAFVACAGAGVVHIWTCYSPTQRTGGMFHSGYTLSTVVHDFAFIRHHIVKKIHFNKTKMLWS